MAEFSQENIERAAEEVRRGIFGDFMFRDPGARGRTSRRRTSGNRNTSRRNTSRRNTSRKNTSRRNTSRRQTSRRVTSRRRTSRRRPVQTRCFDTVQGNNLIRRCFEGSNQSYFSSTKR